MKKRTVFIIVLIVSALLSAGVTVGMLFLGVFHNYTDHISFGSVSFFALFFFAVFFLLFSVLISSRFCSGALQEILFIDASLLLISGIFSFLLFTLIDCGFEFAIIDWLGALGRMPTSYIYYIILIVSFLTLFGLYVAFINKNFFSTFMGKKGNDLKQVSGSNLENSRWMTKKEKQTLFKIHSFSDLGEVEKDGIPVAAALDSKGKNMEVAFNSPCHSIIIGSTGSGKTTTFVSPMIQLLAATKAGSSMVITDPKGELFMLHSKYLKSRGYDVKVIDLRDTYSSYRWNPLDSIWDNFETYKNAHTFAYKRTDSVAGSGLKIDGAIEDFANKKEWYEFQGKAYSDYNRLLDAVKIFKKKTFDEVYEDLNDLVTVLIPVENEKDPLWEKGARSITLAVLLAMLEDSLEKDTTK